MKDINQIAIDLISQYGEDAESIAMLKAEEYDAKLNNEERTRWENELKEKKNK